MTDETKEPGTEGGEPGGENVAIEYEDIEGIRVDTRCSTETKRRVSEGTAHFAEFPPLAKNGEYTRVEHEVMLGSGISYYSEPFKPINLVRGESLEEVEKKREEAGLNQEQVIKPYGLIVTDQGWQWLIDLARKTFPKVDFREPPLHYDQMRGKEAYKRGEEGNPWVRLIWGGFVVKRQALKLNENGEAPFPNIIQVGFDRKLNFDSYAHPGEDSPKPDYVFFDSKPQFINKPSKNSVFPGDWEIFEAGNYRIEHHPEWREGIHGQAL